MHDAALFALDFSQATTRFECRMLTQDDYTRYVVKRLRKHGDAYKKRVAPSYWMRTAQDKQVIRPDRL